MGTLSVSVPDTLKKKMLEMEDINWSAVARKAFEERIDEIEFLKDLANKSKLTVKDAEALSDKINKNMSRKFY